MLCYVITITAATIITVYSASTVTHIHAMNKYKWANSRENIKKYNKVQFKTIQTTYFSFIIDRSMLTFWTYPYVLTVSISMCCLMYINKHFKITAGLNKFAVGWAYIK